MVNKRESTWSHRGGLSKRLTLISMIAVVFVCLGTAYAASTSNFEEEWSKLVAAAQKEGRLVIAAGGQPSRQYRPVLEIFQKKFGVKAELSTGGANDTVNRVAAERKAGKYSFDVILISVRINNLRLIPLGALAPMSPLLIHPEVVNTANWYGKKHWYGDKDLKHTFLYHASVEDNYDMWYNTDKIKGAEIGTIKNQWDFFDAGWKGKIQGQGMGDPSGIRQMIDAWYEPERGPKWVKTYLTEAGVTFAEDRRLLENRLVSGRFRLCLCSGISDRFSTVPDFGVSFVLFAAFAGDVSSLIDSRELKSASPLFLRTAAPDQEPGPRACARLQRPKPESEYRRVLKGR